MNKDNLGDRMKEYENVSRIYLTRKMPLIVRIDGVHFHSFTKGFERPYYYAFREAMWETAKHLCENMMGAKLAYTQSDEITVLLTDDDTLETQAWFGKNLQKIASVSASLATYWFNWVARNNYKEDEPLRVAVNNKIATFDARAFVIPKEEVMNCFEWRQQDCTRNAIESLGRAHFSHNALEQKSCAMIQEMLMQEKGINFNDCPIWYKRGSCVIKKDTLITTSVGAMMTRPKWTIDNDIPIFHKEPQYIEQFVNH